MQKFTKSLNRVLAIQNFGSSGSKLVHALLDNHPNILAIPTLYMMYFYRFWDEDVKKKKDEVIDEFINSHSYWFDPKGYAPWGTDKMGPNRDESIYVERDLFVKNLNVALGGNKKCSRKLFFQSLYVAYALSIGRELDLEPNQYIILFPHHTNRKEVAVELTKDFPNTFFLHCFREIIQTLGSTAKIAFNRWGGLLLKLRKTTAMIELSIFLSDKYVADQVPYKIHAYSPLISEYRIRSKAVKLENLVDNPEVTLKKFCQWIDIPWNDELLKATYNGKIWWNRPESARVTGLSKTPLERKHDDILNNFDRYRLEIILSKLKKKMGYQAVVWNPNALKKALFFISLSLPLKIELISSLPSKYSFYHTNIFISNFRKIIKSIRNKRSLRNTGLGGIRVVIHEIKSFIFGWFLLIPVRSYVKVRILLYKAVNKLLKKELEVVEIL